MRETNRFRLAQASENEKIYLMGFDTWGDEEGLDSYLNACRSSKKYAQGRWFVLCEKGEPVCSALAHDFPSWGKEVVRGIGSLATIPDERERGFGGELLESLTSFLARVESASVIFLYSDIDTQFYEKRGYRALDQRYQNHTGSTAMAWVRPSAAASLVDANSNKIPQYF